MEIFCLDGINEGEKIQFTLNEVIGFPYDTSFEGGYDIVCTLQIDVGCYHVYYDKLCSATGPIYRFARELQECYEKLEGEADYNLLLEESLIFHVLMTSNGHAVVKGEFQEPSSKNILQFEMETDQTCFLSVIQQISKLKKIVESE